MVKPAKKGGKKPYSPPTLVVYGTVRDLTQKKGPTGQPDGGKRFGKNSTQL